MVVASKPIRMTFACLIALRRLDQQGTMLLGFQISEIFVAHRNGPPALSLNVRGWVGEQVIHTVNHQDDGEGPPAGMSLDFCATAERSTLTQ